MAAPLIVFGDMETALANRTFVEYFFENERLPSELGWSKKVDAVTLDEITRMSDIIANATNLQTADTTTSTAAKRRDIIAGFTLRSLRG
ncbi:hypothetical protein LQW54_009922 [Pestalotiopsis sp. IQ-011]